VAGQRAQARVVVGIGQAAHVEHEIGVERDAVLETEGLEQQRQAGGRNPHEILDPVAQDVGPEVAGVHALREVRQSGEQPALALDALGQREAAVGKRVAPPRFGEALDQRVGLRLQEQHPHIVAARAEIAELPRQLGERLRAAQLHAQGHARVAGPRQEAHGLRQQPGRQVVHVVIAAVLEHVEGHALARAGEAGDQYQLH
jgi:hypothetical protein